MKTCPDCGRLLPLEDFPPAKKRADGRATYCRPCMNVRATASRRKRAADEGRVITERRVLPEGTRHCPDCGRIKALDEFPRNRSGKQGHGAYCKPCHNARGKDTRLRLYGGSGEYHRRARYGLELGEFEEMLLDQGDLCAVCGDRPAVHVDHDHATTDVRGILCFNCNGMLGQARDRVDILLAGIRYLERSRGVPWISMLSRWDDFRWPTQRPEAARSRTS